MRAKIPGLTAALALAVAATAPAQAQFMTGPYPVIVVPPPPAQNYVVPKPRDERGKATSEAPVSSKPYELKCSYHGQTRVCE